MIQARLRTVLARDSALAVVLAVLTAVGLAALTGPLAAELGVVLGRTQRAWFLLLSTAQALAVCVRRVRPRTCLVLVAALQVLVTATVSSEATVRGVAVLVAFYSAGACLPLRALLRWGALALGVEVVGTPLAHLAVRALAPQGPGGPAVTPSGGALVLGGVSVLVLYGAAAAAGVAIAARRENVALLEARAVAAEQEREAETRRAVADERLRMARELHDVAAHHLTGLLVQASAAERLVPAGGEAARRALREVRDQGKQALDNLRTVVGVLRQDDAPAPGPGGDASSDLRPVPGLATLPDLVEGARALGDRVVLSTTGTAYPLAPVADVTAYRVAQEALSNARQHAPGEAVEVALAHTASDVRLTVVNALPTVPRARGRTGFGLAGMRERAGLVGATLDAGPVPEGWRVALVLPRPGLGTALDEPPAGAR